MLCVTVGERWIIGAQSELRGGADLAMRVLDGEASFERWDSVNQDQLAAARPSDARITRRATPDDPMLKLCALLGLVSSAAALLPPTSPGSARGVQETSSRRAALSGFAALALGAAAQPAFALRPGCDDPKVCSGPAPPNLFTKPGPIPKDRKVWAVKQGCNVEKPCGKGASLFGPSAGLGAQDPSAKKKK